MARHLTLRQRLLALVALSILPTLAALVSFIVASHQEREREVRDLALRTSELAALEIERIISGADGVLRVLAIAPAVRYLTVDCDAYLAEAAARLPQIRGLMVADPAGTVRCASGFATGSATVADAAWFTAARASQDVVVGEYTPPDQGGPAYLPIAISTGDADRPGVVMAGLDLDWLAARIRERDPAPGSSLAVADRNGVLIAREPDSEHFVGTSVAEAFLPLVHAAVPGVTDVVSRDGTLRVVGYQPPAANGIGLLVSAGYSTVAAFAPIYASTWRSLAISGAGAIAAFAVAWWVGDWLLRRPILRLLATIASWRAGDETARSGLPQDGTEIAALARSIDAYMDNLEEAGAARAEAEQHRTLMMREMNHRIKNTLAAVQAIANQTFSRGASPEGMALFSSRLRAMAAAHDLLVKHDWESSELGETVTAAMAPFGQDLPGRFVIDGPPLRITAKTALALSMALHELATNASKYGALSCPDGRVAIRWDVTPQGCFHLSWMERGGPSVQPPGRRGFGTRLIETALASELSADVRLSYDPAGLTLTVDATVASVCVGEEAEPAEAAPSGAA